MLTRRTVLVAGRRIPCLPLSCPPLKTAAADALADAQVDIAPPFAFAEFSGAVTTYGTSHGHGDHVSPACANSTRRGGL